MDGTFWLGLHIGVTVNAHIDKEIQTYLDNLVRDIHQEMMEDATVTAHIRKVDL